MLPVYPDQVSDIKAKIDNNNKNSNFHEHKI
jgi:hypothetical protein